MDRQSVASGKLGEHLQNAYDYLNASGALSHPDLAHIGQAFENTGLVSGLGLRPMPTDISRSFLGQISHFRREGHRARTNGYMTDPSQGVLASSVPNRHSIC